MISSRNTKLFLLAFTVLSIVPLLVNLHLLSMFMEGEENNHSATSTTSTVSTRNVVKAPKSSNEPPPLDFAIIGFAKTGTTFLHDILANHSQVIMYKDEFWGDVNGLRQWLNTTTTRESSTPPKRRGIKCPRIVKETQRLDQLLYNTSRVIVGVRHPVHWFESLYNYRIWQKHEKKRHRMKPTLKFLHNNRTDWLGLSTGAARFDLYLKQLGKVPLTPHEVFNMKLVNKVYGVMGTTPYQKQHPMKVLLYSMEQLKEDGNATRRRLAFQETLQHFLGLDTPFPQRDLASETKVNENNFQHDENIDICEEQFRDIRNTLVWQGRHASVWIRNKFMKSEDVIVSDVEFMNEVLERWSVDPCDDK